MRAEQERAAVQLRDERALVAEFAGRLRKRAVAGPYAGLRGQDVGLTMAAMLDSIALVLDHVPAQVRRDAVAAARRNRDGPDGRTTRAATARDSPTETATDSSNRD